MLYSVGFKQKFLIYRYILKVFQLKVYIKILSDSCFTGSLGFPGLVNTISAFFITIKR